MRLSLRLDTTTKNTSFQTHIYLVCNDVSKFVPSNNPQPNPPYGVRKPLTTNLPHPFGSPKTKRMRLTYPS